MVFKLQTRQDTGWGLIYRLNNILAKIERDIENGDLNRWNLHLDRVFVNIIYKNEEEKVLSPEGKVIGVNLSQDDMEIFSVFNKQINELNNQIKIAKQNEQSLIEIKKINDRIYALLLKKDIWIRKKMFQLKLYLREGESDPRKAIYGG
jgi:hypothetical protein